MPASFSAVTTGKAPTPRLAIIWIASYTEASGEMDQTVCPFACKRSSTRVMGQLLRRGSGRIGRAHLAAPEHVRGAKRHRRQAGTHIANAQILPALSFIVTRGP